MSAQAVIEQFKALPLEERAEVARFVIESDAAIVAPMIFAYVLGK